MKNIKERLDEMKEWEDLCTSREFIKSRDRMEQRH